MRKKSGKQFSNCKMNLHVNIKKEIISRTVSYILKQSLDSFLHFIISGSLIADYICCMGFVHYWRLYGDLSHPVYFGVLSHCNSYHIYFFISYKQFFVTFCPVTFVLLNNQSIYMIYVAIVAYRH